MVKRLAILFILIFASFMWSAVVFAETGSSAPVPGMSEEQIKAKVDTLLPPRSDILVDGKKDINLPAKDFKKGIIPGAIKMILALTGTVSFGVFVYAGVMLIIAQGNEEEITKFKNILIWSLVGLTFVIASYAIVSGVMQLIFK